MKIIPDRDSHFDNFYQHRIPYTTNFTFNDKKRTYRPEAFTDHKSWGDRYIMHGDDYDLWVLLKKTFLNNESKMVLCLWKIFLQTKGKLQILDCNYEFKVIS